MDRAAESLAIDAWCRADAARAVHPADRDVIESTRTLRALIVELIHAGPVGRDVFQACAELGRHLAERGASPTLAALTIDGAREALGVDAPWEPMRAALVEGYAAVQREFAQRGLRAAWEYPACAVRLDATTMAVAAGHPDDDIEALSAWADRVARAVVRAGSRRVVVSGKAGACDALRAALETAGIEVLGELPQAPPAKRFRLWPLS